MKKKILLSIMGIMVIGGMLVGCGKKESNLDTLEKIKNSKTFEVGLSADYPPFEYTNEKNEFLGFDVELAKTIAEKMGVELKIVNIPFNGIVEGLKAKKFDMIASGFSVNEEREKEVLFSAEYLDGGQYVVLNSDNDDVKNVEDLKDKVIGVQIGTTSAEAAKKIENVKQVKEYDTVAQALMDLQNKRIDAVVIDKPVCEYYLSQEGGSYKKIDANIQKEPTALAFRKEDDKLKDEVNKILEDLKNDGTLSELSKKWFGYDAYKK